MTSEQQRIKRIMLLVCAESEEKVLEQLKKDICVGSGIDNHNHKNM